ncbi:MAG TPA: DUF4435 domain-containing protein [Blastocatellia bacterium]|nr:DUF4435 domain-containing protein [Blastocatellia bacterium]
MRTISSLPPELTQILFDAGSRIVVLVEGEDDREVLREWFAAERVEVEFYECGGITTLIKWLNELLTLGTRKRAYGITDRDFRSDEEVEASYADTSHQFILRRYALENYLLEAQSLWQVLRVRHPEIINELPDEQAMAAQLLERCQKLKSITAANWVFFEASQYSPGIDPEYFSVGYDTDRELIIRQAANRLQCSEAETEKLILEKEQLIEAALAQLATAHRVIDGKRLLHWIQREQFKTSGGDDYLRRLLTREIQLHSLPEDIVHIVRERIIAPNRT